MINLIFFSIVLFWASIILHEYGHYAYFKYIIGKTVHIKYKDLTFEVGELKDYVTLSRKQKFDVYFSGVMLGLLIIVYFGYFTPVFYLLIPFHLWASKSDLYNMLRFIQ